MCTFWVVSTPALSLWTDEHKREVGEEGVKNGGSGLLSVVWSSSRIMASYTFMVLQDVVICRLSPAPLQAVKTLNWRCTRVTVASRPHRGAAVPAAASPLAAWKSFAL